MIYCYFFINYYSCAYGNVGEFAFSFLVHPNIQRLLIKGLVKLRPHIMRRFFFDRLAIEINRQPQLVQEIHVKIVQIFSKNFVRYIKRILSFILSKFTFRQLPSMVLLRQFNFELLHISFLFRIFFTLHISFELKIGFAYSKKQFPTSLRLLSQNVCFVNH